LPVRGSSLIDLSAQSVADTSDGLQSVSDWPELLAEVPDDEIRIDVMQAAPRPTGYYRIFVSRKVLQAGQPRPEVS